MAAVRISPVDGYIVGREYIGLAWATVVTRHPLSFEKKTKQNGWGELEFADEKKIEQGPRQVGRNLSKSVPLGFQHRGKDKASDQDAPRASFCPREAPAGAKLHRGLAMNAANFSLLLF